MGQLMLDPDDRDTWDEAIQTKIHHRRPTSSPVRQTERHKFLLRCVEEEVRKIALIKAGACRWCLGTDFYQGPGGNWVCRKCHPPFGTTLTATMTYRSNDGNWHARTVTVG